MWRPNPRLCTQLNKADSICLPLLKIRKEGGGFLALSYTAPTPTLLPESALGRRIAGLCARAREKCLFLGGRLRQAQQAGNQDDALEIRRQLTALWVRLPEVEGALSSRIAHPQTLYVHLLGLAGAWSALDPPDGLLVDVTGVAHLYGGEAALLGESADLLFHLTVLLAEKGVPLAEVMAELDRREGVSGLIEKASRSE